MKDYETAAIEREERERSGQQQDIGRDAAQGFEREALAADAAKAGLDAASRRDPDAMVRFATDRLEDAGIKAAETAHSVRNEVERLGDNARDVWNHTDRDADGFTDAEYNYGDQMAKEAVPGGRYTGKIVGDDGQKVYQQLNDPDKTLMSHNKAALSGAHEHGQNVEIHYPHGRAGLVKDVDRQVQAGDRDHGHDRQDMQREVER